MSFQRVATVKGKIEDAHDILCESATASLLIKIRKSSTPCFLRGQVRGHTTKGSIKSARVNLLEYNGTDSTIQKRFFKESTCWEKDKSTLVYDTQYTSKEEPKICKAAFFLMPVHGFFEV